MKPMMILIVIGMLGIVPKGLEKKTCGTGNQRKNQNYSGHSIVLRSAKRLGRVLET